MPRVKTFDQKEALGKAMELFWEKGYEATSLSDLTTRLNIGKGSFYDTFKSKRALFEQCLKTYQDQSMEVLKNMLADISDPVEIFRTLLREHTRMMLSDNSPKGCFIANSTTELADDKLIQEFLKSHNQIMRTKLNQILSNSKYADRSDELADLTITHLTGISVMSKLVRDEARFEASNEMFMKVFE